MRDLPSDLQPHEEPLRTRRASSRWASFRQEGLTMGTFVFHEPAWMLAPPTAAQVAGHVEHGGRWLCSPQNAQPCFMDLRVWDGRVVVYGCGSELKDVLADRDNHRRFVQAKWARSTLEGVPLLEVTT
jgi:hypothetical protein